MLGSCRTGYCSISMVATGHVENDPSPSELSYSSPFADAMRLGSAPLRCVPFLSTFWRPGIATRMCKSRFRGFLLQSPAWEAYRQLLANEQSKAHSQGFVLAGALRAPSSTMNAPEVHEIDFSELMRELNATTLAHVVYMPNKVRIRASSIPLPIQRRLTRYCKLGRALRRPLSGKWG